MIKLKHLILIGLLSVPVFAYLDAIIIAGLSFQDYLYVCVFEYVIWTIGILTGIKLVKREK